MKFPLLSLALVCLAGQAYGQNIDISNAWVRASVPGQQATGAFMTITAKDATTLRSVSSAMAGVAELHEMKMDGDVMRMRAVPQGLALAAGQSVVLKPGGYHVMLMDLKAGLPPNSSVPLTLVFQDAKGVQSQLELTLPVAVSAPGTASGTAPAAGHGGKHAH